MSLETMAADAIQVALAHHQAGRLDEAEQIYRQLLAARPNDAGVVQLLGLIALQRGQFQLAESCICQAIRLDGGQAVFHGNLGEVYRAMGRPADARACYERALAISPRMAEARNNLGTLLQAEGRHDEAIGCYQEALAVRPDFADALNNLGSALQDQGNLPGAIAAYRRAVEVEPLYARGYFNLGVAYQRSDEQDELATECFLRALEISPDYVDARYGLAMVLQKRKLWNEAEAEYRRTLAKWPGSSEVTSSLGTLYQAQSRFDEAIAQYREALRLDPANAKAYYNWGTALVEMGQAEAAAEKYRQALVCRPEFADAHYNLGTVLHQLGQLEAAADSYHSAIELRPEMALAHNNLGNVYHLLGKSGEAIACYREALRVSPAYGEVYNNLGTAYQDQGQLDQTVQCYREAMRLLPDCADTYSNLAAALQQQGDYVQAEQYFAKSLQLAPESPEAHYNRSFLLLAQERFAEGWLDFAWRMKCKKYPRRHFDQPLWEGGALQGRTLLVHAEQGFGDTMQFVRYLSELRRSGGTVIFESQPQLLPLLCSSRIEGVVAAGESLPSFDCYAPILSLPGMLGTTLDTIPRGVPYLAADPGLVDAWRRELAGLGEFKVGIHWQGNRAYKSDHARSIPLANFAPLATVRGLTMFSLQKNEDPAQLAEITAGWPLYDLAPTLDVEHGAFMDTAAVMKNLDLVITSDTATAHLAGALGVPVWLATCYAPEWRWLLGRDDSPWYPSMRLVRQATPGDWAGVFARIADDLRELL
jgi:tetratricopeptide (TPR) repeat protein